MNFAATIGLIAALAVLICALTILGVCLRRNAGRRERDRGGRP